MNFQIDLMIAALDKDEVEVAEGEDDDQFEQVTHAAILLSFLAHTQHYKGFFPSCGAA